ncbi:hypothetical protein C8Q73DRAFT_19179 [Cubamyces lactineus]|nr:hypothetical protein C8Q73DRAFT_19179 [Cubamyces lactineus]
MARRQASCITEVKAQLERGIRRSFASQRMYAAIVFNQPGSQSPVCVAVDAGQRDMPRHALVGPYPLHLVSLLGRLKHSAGPTPGRESVPSLRAHRASLHNRALRIGSPPSRLPCAWWHRRHKTSTRLSRRHGRPTAGCWGSSARVYSCPFQLLRQPSHPPVLSLSQRPGPLSIVSRCAPHAQRTLPCASCVHIPGLASDLRVRND